MQMKTRIWYMAMMLVCVCIFNGCVEKCDNENMPLSAALGSDEYAKYVSMTESVVMLLIEGKINASSKELHEKMLQSMLPSCYNGQNCYIMAYYETIDGTVCSYEEALKLVLGNGMAAIIIFDGFAVVETEQYAGSAQKFALCNGKI